MLQIPDDEFRTRLIFVFCAVSWFLVCLQTEFPKTLKMVFAGTLRLNDLTYSGGVRQAIYINYHHRNISGTRTGRTAENLVNTASRCHFINTKKGHLLVCPLWV